MTPIFDLIQIALESDIICPFAAFALFILIAVTWKATGEVWRFGWQVLRKIKSLFPKLTIWNAVKCAVFVIFVSFKWQWLSLQIQYIETKYINPVTSGEFSGYSSDKVTAIYEAELRRHVLDDEFRVIQDSVRAMSLQFGCDSSAIYECAYPECSLNPFVVRQDEVAAGFIQFTSLGCAGLPFNLATVKNWCYTRNAKAMMSATRQYLQRAANGRPLKTGKDIYLAVFCPSKIGSGPDAVLYDSGPAYEMNKQLDGWVLESGKIVRSPSAVDHRITAGELGLWMERKKIDLIKRSQNKL